MDPKQDDQPAAGDQSTQPEVVPSVLVEESEPNQPEVEQEPKTTAQESSESPEQAQPSNEADNIATSNSHPDQEPAQNTAVQPLDGSSKKKKLLLFALPVLLIITVVGVFLALKVFGGDQIKLTTYDSNKFSISYPEGYTIKNDNDNVTEFIESNEEGAEKDTLSSVQVIYIDLASLNEQQKSLVRNGFSKFNEEVVNSSKGDIVEGEVKNEVLDEMDFLGSRAKRLVADVYKNNEKHSDLYLVNGDVQNKIVIIVVGQHVSDEGLIEQARTIVDSFKLK